MEQKSTKAYKISFKKIHRAAVAEMRVHKKLSIITLVLFGVAMLLFMFNSDVYEVEKGMARFNPLGWGVFFACCGIAVGYFTALNVFRDMNNQQLCDVSMSLPIKSSERFFSKILSLFYIQIFPLIVSTLGGNGIALLIGTANVGKISPDTSKYAFIILFAALAGSIFIMAIAVLCACCCGAMAESAYFSIILMFILNALPMLFMNNIVSRSAGFSNWFLDQTFDLGYFGILFLLTDLDEMIPHCIVSALISLAIMLLSGFIYVKRDARSVGTPIASKLFFEIIMALGCATVFAMFAMSSAAMWGVLISLVAYIIINIIVSRAKINALSFLKWGGKYVVTLAAFTVLLVVTIKTGGFGYINARPAAEYLDGANFEISYADYDRPISSVYGGYTYYTKKIEAYNLTPEQADEVMTICKKHLAAGRAKVNPFDVIFDDEGYYNVRINARGEKYYDFRPSPRSQFSGYDYRGYCLDFGQQIYIPDSEAEAMIDELSALDFVQVS